MPWRESLADSYKDMKNNFEGSSYGLKTPMNRVECGKMIWI